MKRPPGVTIVAVLFLIIGMLTLIPRRWAFVSGGLLHTILFISLPPILFIVSAIGLLKLRSWGRGIAQVLVFWMAYWNYFIVRDGRLFDPRSYRIDPHSTIQWNIETIQFGIVIWVLVILPILTLYFLVLDKATVAAFKKTP